MEIKKQDGRWKATRYYCNSSDICNEVNGLKEIITRLKTELRNSKYLGETRHNLEFGIYFRGESKEHKNLLPSIGRCDKQGRDRYTRDDERNMLHRFRRRSYSHYQRILNDWETIFLARHHLVPTRLIDWTSNYLVALYWACENETNIEEDGAIWTFVRQPEEEWDLNVFNARLLKRKKYVGDVKFLVEGVKIIFPFYVSPRMTAQGGLFTIQDDPWKPLEKYCPTDYERKDFDILHIRKWKVSGGAGKRGIMEELDEIGINIQTLYPGLEGLGRGIPKVEEIRKNLNAGDKR